jgi:hypothetical protein
MITPVRKQPPNLFILQCTLLFFGDLILYQNGGPLTTVPV